MLIHISDSFYLREEIHTPCTTPCSTLHENQVSSSSGTNTIDTSLVQGGGSRGSDSVGLIVDVEDDVCISTLRKILVPGIVDRELLRS
jgi:hypothetical protein